MHLTAPALFLCINQEQCICISGLRGLVVLAGCGGKKIIHPGYEGLGISRRVSRRGQWVKMRIMSSVSLLQCVSEGQRVTGEKCVCEGFSLTRCVRECSCHPQSQWICIKWWRIRETDVQEIAGRWSRYHSHDRDPVQEDICRMMNRVKLNCRTR